jgi:glycerol-3-phosphate dehydrogenase (NAD(P)+)
MRRTRRNSAYLPDLVLPDAVDVVWLDDEGAFTGSTIIVCATPSRAAAQVSRMVARRVSGPADVLNLTKGLDPETGRVLSETWSAAFGDRLAFCALTGPNHAEEISAGQPAASVVGGDRGLAERVQGLLSGERYRVYVNDDLVGLQLGAASKNVIALAAGMSDGLGFGDNTKASLMTRGLAEMTRLGVAQGARLETFLGLAGMGDLIATCTSRHSRNRRAGELLASGVAPDEVEARVGQVVEGLATVRSLLGMADHCGVELPISAEVDAVVHHGRAVRDSMRSLMTRSPVAE